MKKLLCVLMSLVILTFAVGCSQTDGQANEEPAAWPDDTVTIVCPSKAGGNTDGQVRIVAEYLQNKMGQPFVVKNLAEGRGSVGYDTVRKAEPDGKTLLMYHASFPVAIHTGGYDASIDEDFTRISTVQNGGYATIVVREDSPYYTLQDLVDAAKANPDEIKWGAKIGKISNFFPIMLEQDAGIDFDIVDADGEVSLLGGHVEVTNMNIPAADQNVKAGKMRILAVLTTERSPDFPDYPTATELGFPGVYLDGNYALYGPAGMDEGLVTEINAALKDMETDEGMVEKFSQFGRFFKYRTVEESRDAMINEEGQLEELVKVMGQ